MADMRRRLQAMEGPRQLPIAQYPRPGYAGAAFKGAVRGGISALEAWKQRKLAGEEREREATALTERRAYEAGEAEKAHKRRLEELEIMYPEERFERAPPKGWRPTTEFEINKEAARLTEQERRSLVYPSQIEAFDEDEVFLKHYNRLKGIPTGAADDDEDEKEPAKQPGFFQRAFGRGAPIRGLEELKEPERFRGTTIRERAFGPPAAPRGVEEGAPAPLDVLGGAPTAEAGIPEAEATRALDAVEDPDLAEKIERARATSSDAEIYDFLVQTGKLAPEVAPPLPEVRGIPGLTPPGQLEVPGR